MRGVQHVIHGSPHRLGGVGGGGDLGPAPFNRVTNSRPKASPVIVGRFGLAAETAVGHGNPVDLYQSRDDSLRQDDAEDGTLGPIYPAAARTAWMMRSCVGGSR